ncbi:uncharacterized protein LOC120348459 [Styela clava]
MPGSGRKYGVQVGNETYSLIMTQEDWEKRRLEREHAKKLSLATNKRRRALEDRKRLAERRENRKRELELFKRRQRQIEATERYQHFRINAKDRKDHTAELTQTIPSLEEILQRVRGGDGDGVNSTVTYQDYAKSTPTSLHQPRQYENQTPNQTTRSTPQTAKEFSEDINREILELKHAESGLQQDVNLLDDNDGQDSLHGSSLSGSSSVSTNYIKKYDNSTNSTISSDLKFQHKNNHHIATEHEIPPSPQLQNTNYTNAALTTYVENKEPPNTSVSEANGKPIMHSFETGVLCKRDATTGRITYYVKSYRPWSAGMTNKSQKTNSFNNITESLNIRSRSSYEESKPNLPISPTKTSQKHFESWTSSAGYIIHNKTPIVLHQSRKPTQQPRKVPETPYIDIKPSQTSASIRRGTTSTPVSPFFNEEQNQKNAVVTSNKDPTAIANTFEMRQENTPAATKKISVTKIGFVTSPDNVIGQKTPKNDKIDEQSDDAQCDQDDNKKERIALKGILRRYSKYDSELRNAFARPAYQSAGIARQKWLHGINVITTDDRDRNRNRAHSAETKSVRWHQVQYNDGTSSALDMHENTPVQFQASPVPKPQVVRNSEKSVKQSSKKIPVRPKTSPARAIKGGKGRGSGRKFYQAKEVSVKIQPHPPPQKKSPNLSMSTCINYSIDPNEDSKPSRDVKASPGEIFVNSAGVTRQRSPAANNNKRASVLHNKIMFHRKGKLDNRGEAVTMSTLKSQGNLSQPSDEIRNVNQGNQVTINVTSSKPITYGSSSWRKNLSTDITHRIPLNGTPTDQEIDLLWDKVRAYLAWNKSRITNNTAAVKNDYGTSERKIAWGSSQLDTSSKQISANIISIDGGIFSKISKPEDQSFQTHSKTQHYKGNGTQKMQSKLEKHRISKSAKNVNSYSSQQQYGGQDFRPWSARGSQLQEKVGGTIPLVTNVDPAFATMRRQQLTESVKTFRLVEALIEQNVPEEQILKALDSLQTATREI